MGRRGLGRGLSALISAGDSVGGLRFEEVPVSAIRPNTHQPRRQFSETSIKELAASIREVGILQPLVIRSTEATVPGSRRGPRSPCGVQSPSMDGLCAPPPARGGRALPGTRPA